MSNSKMTFNATCSMAIGGMVGGGIFSVLGVVLEIAGQWVWLSFLLAGIIAFLSAHSYSQLSIKYKEGGGAFTFLRKIHHKGIAGSLSWVLILGYILTISVYAFTFGHYVAHLFNVGPWLPRLLGLLIIFSLAALNLRGVGDMSKVEVFTVWIKVLILITVSLFGVFLWEPSQLTQGIDSKPIMSGVIAAAIIFMAYEGFQLLAYDYEDLKNPDTTLPRATSTAILIVIGIYILVWLGATMLVGAETLIEKKEVALSIAGQNAMGTFGLILVTLAAVFSTASAINATLFSTGRLMENVAEKGDLPQLVSKENSKNIPSNAILVISGLAAILAVIGSLGQLVDAASLIFLITFCTVNIIAYRENVKWKMMSLAGAFFCLVAIYFSVTYQFKQSPIILTAMLVLVLSLFLFEPYVLQWMKNKERH